MSEEQFLHDANSADMLFFRGNKGASGLIRNLTGGYFDHVALVVRTPEEGTHDLTFLESVGGHGVSANTWSNIKYDIGPGKFYSKVCLRRLNIERTDDFLEIYDDFINEVW
eukprot:CAMPEP_0116885804 /NCGR_PEP_ID=MMETSP0463-20121206/19397_1 /TAXON_ID=181622 /ORGANISM="Strombidinopsis sp, Strain SopsisLIS2011" /LENGTH=110 /DNA_ID=CAMNT_0004545077 /DNA_START=616 /DNA_END=948 /DNA_ORIENTATION=-